MNINKIVLFIIIIIILAVVSVFFSQNSPDQSKPEPKENQQQIDQQYYWGVDSASYTDKDLYTCVQDEFGEPQIWGRYIGTIEDVSAGLDADEVAYLHNKQVHILVIYNHFSDATGYDHGVEEAQKAIAFAKELSIPKDVAIFGDIEPTYKIDTNFIEGWYDALADSRYEPALYGVFDKESDLVSSFENSQDDVQENMIIWTAYPQAGITTKNNAPSFDGVGPKGAIGWQYGQDAEACNIDTNIFSAEIIDYLWKADE